MFHHIISFYYRQPMQTLELAETNQTELILGVTSAAGQNSMPISLKI